MQARMLDGIDASAFAEGLRALREELDASLSEADLAHLRKIERWGRLAGFIGWSTSWIAPNPLSALSLGLARSTRWLLMHHISHKGYDKVPGVPPRYTSRHFARGWRRMIDWPDWMLPGAWSYEHNILHHHHTGQLRDPDLIEAHAEPLQAIPGIGLRYLALALIAITWRPSYYARNTLRVWLQRERRPGFVRTLLFGCYLPYTLLYFVLLPLLFLPLGAWAVSSVLLNSVFADLICNLHTILVVGPNHAGDDVFRFDGPPASKNEYYLRQVLGSVNYSGGGTDLRDYAHLWLNYQIEHHLWPDLPMLRYRMVAPKVKALCEKCGIPYIEESLFARVRKTIEVLVGRTSMPRIGKCAAPSTSDTLRPVRLP